MPASEKYNVSAWSGSVEEERDFRTPAGHLCRVRSITFEDVIALDIIDKIDSLSAIVQTDHIERVGGKKPSDRPVKKLTKAQVAQAEKESESKVMRAVMKDKEKWGELVGVMGDVIMCCVVEPKILDPWVNTPEGRRKLAVDERDPNAAYLDRVAFTDRFALFEEVFGDMGDLERFREESDEGVGAVAAEPVAAENS